MMTMISAMATAHKAWRRAPPQLTGRRADGRARSEEAAHRATRPRCSDAPLRHCRPHAVAFSAFSSCMRPTFLAHLHPPLNVAGSRASLMSRLSGTWPVSPSTAPSASGNTREFPRPSVPSALRRCRSPSARIGPPRGPSPRPHLHLPLPPHSPASTLPRLQTPSPPTAVVARHAQEPARRAAQEGGGGSTRGRRGLDAVSRL